MQEYNVAPDWTDFRGLVTTEYYDKRLVCTTNILERKNEKLYSTIDSYGKLRNFKEYYIL